MLTEEQLKALKAQSEDADWQADASPEQIAWRNYMLKNYGKPDPENPSPFAQRYGKYYAPFLLGSGKVGPDDIPPNVYKAATPFDSAASAKKKYLYNDQLSKKSAIDPIVTAASAGAGMIPMMSGTPLGMAGGMALKHGVPLIWSLLKQRMAKKAAGRKMGASIYKKITGKI
jgi:hypothetical protein